MKRILSTAVAVVSLAAGLAFAQGKDAKVTSGEPKPPQGVNWAGQIVKATGGGAPDLKAQNAAQARLGAERAALNDALRNLLAQVKGISVDGSKKMSDLMEKDEVKTRVEGLVRGYKVSGKRYFSDNGVEVDIEVPLALLTEVVDPDATQVAPVAAPAPTPAAPPAKGQPTPAAEPAKTAVAAATGLVIDARGLKLTPALTPRLLDDAGKSLYSIDFLSPEARKTSAVASYVQSLEEAQKSLKAGDKPLVLKASKATGADLQLAPEDAKRIASVGGLAEGKVVIVLN